MNRKVALITQSNYIPWKGYFESIAKSDLFVIYDDVQYTKRDWRNRNLIKTKNGLQWLTIPVEVSGRYSQRIDEVKVADPKWQTKHWETIRHAYRQAPAFEEVSEWLEPLFVNATHEYLTDVNQHLLNGICERLLIKTEVRRSSEFQLSADRNERLVELCVMNNVNHYITGPAAKAYLDESLFMKHNVTVEYLDYSGYPEYQQSHGPFVHGVSVIDVLFATGSAARSYVLP